MADRPYVAPGTPVTITIDGNWDGYHNGNQPVATVPNHLSEPKKFHVPHGARVATRPNAVEPLEFTVDKTPKPETCLAMWYGYRCGNPPNHKGRHRAPQGFEFGSVTDTGEPAPEPTPRIPDESVCRSCEDSDEAFCYQHRYMSSMESTRFRKFWNEYNATGVIPMWAQLSAPEPTPRKPEPGCGNCEGVDPKPCVMNHDAPPQPGDRVRAAGVEFQYLLQGIDNDPVLMADNGNLYRLPADAEITVLERATPAVPEEPSGVLVVEDKGGVIWVRGDLQPGYDWEPTNQGFDAVCWSDLWAERGPLRQYKRGAVVGGE